MYAVHERLMAFSAENGATFNDMCYKWVLYSILLNFESPINYLSKPTKHITVHICRLPIEELFYHGKNERIQKKKEPNVITTTLPTTTVLDSDSDYDEDDYDIWDDYFDIPETSTKTYQNITKENKETNQKKGDMKGLITLNSCPNYLLNKH